MKKATIHGFGINDSKVPVTKKKNGKIVWRNPAFVIWATMIKRCYSESYIKSNPSYKDITVCEDWKYFSNFLDWVKTQGDIGDKHLDKDLKVPFNKIYSPETCLLIPPHINYFIETKSRVPKYGTGVRKMGNRYAARLTMYGKEQHIGMFSTAEEAQKAYKKAKIEHGYKLAEELDDTVLKESLINYIDKVMV